MAAKMKKIQTISHDSIAVIVEPKKVIKDNINYVEK